MHRLLIGLVSYLIAMVPVFAASADLVVSPLSVSPSVVTHGQSVNLIVRVSHVSAMNLAGVVKFSVDGRQVGTDQPVSIRAGGSPDEAFTTWRAVAGTHTIRATLVSTTRDGDDPSNNIASTTITVDTDTDGDGIGDRVDTDDDGDMISDDDERRRGIDPLRFDTDGDGVNDAIDAFPTNPRESADLDRDSVGDSSDPDIDGDGVSNVDEVTRGTNPRSSDSDGDSVGDASDAFPNDKTETRDTDGDGVGDHVDLFPTDPHERRDTDGDGVPDGRDPDADGDGVCDTTADVASHICHLNADHTADAFPRDKNEAHDTDGDGVGDAVDDDNDNDGVCDTLPPRGGCRTNAGHTADAFPLDATEWHDADGDELGDNADPNDANRGPIVDVGAWTSRVVTAGSPLTLDGRATHDPDGRVVSMAWDMGDGIPIADGAMVTHTFAHLGRYTARLIAMDDAGETRVGLIAIIVENPPYLDYLLIVALSIVLGSFIFAVWQTVEERRLRA